MKPVTREQAIDMAAAHAEGWHSDLPREGCPECEERPIRSYPTLADRENRPDAHEAGHDRHRTAR